MLLAINDKRKQITHSSRAANYEPEIEYKIRKKK